MIEGEALFAVVHPDPSIEFVECFGQPAQILVVSARRDIDVVRRLEWSSLGDGGECTDNDVVDPVVVEDSEDVLGREIRPVHLFLAFAENWATLRRWRRSTAAFSSLERVA